MALDRTQAMLDTGSDSESVADSESVSDSESVADSESASDSESVSDSESAAAPGSDSVDPHAQTPQGVGYHLWGLHPPVSTLQGDTWMH